ncbi:iron-containing alcohol dehydrogenase [Effusibacillus pohliae]|uniref:iron-containing alcohol dehydrogenase n=1 Tax=Effusibacillus pohliae TaxID=232270 RepID=UPI00036E0ABE|nr:iron-containing alcohol dehydrogenase [Effusibacillus pohliae]
MLNFQLHMPTRILFGAGEVEKAGEEAAQYGRKLLLVTGRTATKKTGVLDRVVRSLQTAGLEVLVFDRIEPNPRAATIDEGGRIAREAKCNAVIALGGGSVMDAAKAIATVAVSNRPIHEYLAGGQTGLWKELLPIREALPVITIPTLAATGSEANSIAVVTNWETKEKASISGPALFPVVAILDPELTYTVPASYTADGCADIFTHLYEGYLTGEGNAHVQDEITEGLMRTVIRFSRTVLDDPTNYEARAAILWASTLALIGIAGAGRGGSFPLHQMEHPLSGHYDISHGRGLAILAPAYFRHVYRDRPERFARMGRRVFGVQETDDLKAAEAAIAAVEAWFAEIGVAGSLKKQGIPRDALARMAADAVRIGGRGNGFIPGIRELREPDVLAIYEACYE